LSGARLAFSMQERVLTLRHAENTLRLMETVTLKLDRRHIEMLKEHAAASGRSQAAVVRDLIEQYLGRKRRPSLHDQAKDLCGSVSLSTNASTRRLKGYGRD